MLYQVGVCGAHVVFRRRIWVRVGGVSCWEHREYAEEIWQEISMPVRHSDRNGGFRMVAWTKTQPQIN